MKLYRITIDVTAKNLGNAIALVSREGTNLTVSEIEAPHNLKRKVGPRGPNQIGNKSAANTRSGKVILDHLKTNGSSHMAQLGAALAAEGFSAKTASPLITRLTAEGLVRRADGRIALSGG